MDWSVSEVLAAQAIGREVLKYMGAERFSSIVHSDAVQVLDQIQSVLDDDSLDDPECFQKIEAIVTAFQRYGLPVARHDFG